MEELQEHSVRLDLSRGCIRLIPERRPATLLCYAVVREGAMLFQFSLGNKSFEAVVITWLITGSILSLI